MKRRTKSNEPKAEEKRPSSQKERAEVEKAVSTTARLFGIDVRSLAAFRIFISALLLIDLAIRASDLRAMYTDAGMFSRAEIAQRVATVWNWSFHFGGGSASFQMLLFGVAAIFAIALLLGYETRLAAIGSWLMLISVHHRVPPVLSGADVLLRMLLFWAMFVPLGRTWSVERLLSEKKREVRSPRENLNVLTVGTAAILLQMGMMYLFSAISKTNTEWLKGGVIASSLAHDFYAKPLGTWLLQYPAMLKVMTWGVFVLEWAGPLMLFSPWRTKTLRLVGIALLVAMHIGIALTMEVDFFSFVAVAGLLLFVPAEVWERMALRMNAEKSTETRQRERTPFFIAGQTCCAVALLYIVFVNIGSTRAQSSPGNGFFGMALGLKQKWNMFDEAPSKDGWYLAVAELEDGSRVDLLRNGAAVDWGRPTYPAANYPNFRWRKLFREMAYEDAFGYQHFRRPVAEYLVREWNRTKERKIRKLELVFRMEKDVPGSRTVKEVVDEKIVEVQAEES